MAQLTNEGELLVEDYFSVDMTNEHIEIMDGTSKRQCQFTDDSIKQRSYNTADDTAIGTFVISSTFITSTENADDDGELEPHTKSKFNWYGKCFSRIGLSYHGYTDDSCYIREESKTYFLRHDGRILTELDDVTTQEQRKNYLWGENLVITKTFEYYNGGDETFVFFDKDDVVGVHLDFELKTISFSLNGDDLGVAFRDWKHENACFQFCLIPDVQHVTKENSYKSTPKSIVATLLTEKEALVEIKNRKEQLGVIVNSQSDDNNSSTDKSTDNSIDSSKDIDDGEKELDEKEIVLASENSNWNAKEKMNTNSNDLKNDKTYNLEQLMDKQFCKSNGIDIAKRESYLSQENFISTFGMTKVDFDQLKPWKKTSLKKKVKLF